MNDRNSARVHRWDILSAAAAAAVAAVFSGFRKSPGGGPKTKWFQTVMDWWVETVKWTSGQTGHLFPFFLFKKRKEKKKRAQITIIRRRGKKEASQREEEEEEGPSRLRRVAPLSRFATPSKSTLNTMSGSLFSSPTMERDLYGQAGGRRLVVGGWRNITAGRSPTGPTLDALHFFVHIPIFLDSEGCSDATGGRPIILPVSLWSSGAMAAPRLSQSSPERPRLDAQRATA